MECELSGVIVIAFLHLVVVDADIALEVVAVSGKVCILQSAEHCVGLGVGCLSLDSCLAVAGSAVCVIDGDVRIKLIELCNGDVIVCLAHCGVEDQISGRTGSLLCLCCTLSEDGCDCNQSDKYDT